MNLFLFNLIVGFCIGSILESIICIVYDLHQNYFSSIKPLSVWALLNAIILLICIIWRYNHGNI